MIAFNNGVANVRQTPGISADTLANRPAATVVAVGTIYITSDTNNIYRSDGENWILIGSGSGGGVNPTSQIIPYNQAGTFADSYLINDTFNNELFTTFGDQKGFRLVLGDNEFYFGWNESTNNNSNLFCDINQCVIGDSQGNYNGIRLIVSDNNQFIRTSEGGTLKGINFDYSTETYNFGTEPYMLNFDITNSLIQTYTNGNKFGFRLKNTEAEFGAYNGSTNILINETALSININAATAITMGTTNATQFTFGANKLTFNGANLVATGVHTSTANHLKVTVNGANYVIQLLTP
jgi:hypothetical protein